MASESETDPRVAAINADHQCPHCEADWPSLRKVTSGRYVCDDCQGTHRLSDIHD